MYGHLNVLFQMSVNYKDMYIKFYIYYKLFFIRFVITVINL